MELLPAARVSRGNAATSANRLRDCRPGRASPRSRATRGRPVVEHVGGAGNLTFEVCSFVRATVVQMYERAG